VILCSTIELLFEFQNRIFLSFKLSEHQTVRSSGLRCIFIKRL
jgi:hypothetical protein